MLPLSVGGICRHYSRRHCCQSLPLPPFVPNPFAAAAHTCRRSHQLLQELEPAATDRRPQWHAPGGVIYGVPVAKGSVALLGGDGERGCELILSWNMGLLSTPAAADPTGLCAAAAHLVNASQPPRMEQPSMQQPASERGNSSCAPALIRPDKLDSRMGLAKLLAGRGGGVSFVATVRWQLHHPTTATRLRLWGTLCLL